MDTPMLGNGQGKVRSNTQGIAKPPARWRLIFLSSGEISLSDHVASSGKRVMAGQDIRLVNIPADAGAGLGLFDTIHEHASAPQFAELLRSNAASHFGSAGLAWVEVIADPERRPAALAVVAKVKAEFVGNYVPSGAAGQVSRVAGRFGLVAGVGEACIEAGILPWAPGSAIHAARKCFLDWVEQRGGTESHETEAAITQVRLFLENHGESRFTQWDEAGSDDGLDAQSRTVHRAGFRRIQDDGSIHFYVLPEVFRRELCQGLDSKEVAKTLLDRGFLVPGSDGKPQSARRLPGVATTSRVYLITSAILGQESNGHPALSVTQAA